MTQERDIERVLDHWLAVGPSEAPDRVVGIVVERIERQPQRPAWRLALSDRFALIGSGQVGRAAAVIVIAVLSLGAAMIVLGPGVGGGPVSVPDPTATLGPRVFEVEVDELTDPPGAIPVTVLDETGLVVRVNPHPASRDDQLPFDGPLPMPSIVVVNPHADVSFSRAIVLWLADPSCDERVTMTLTREGDGLHIDAVVTSFRRDFPSATGPGPGRSGPVGPACAVFYPLGVELDLSEPYPANRFTSTFTRVPSG